MDRQRLCGIRGYAGQAYRLPHARSTAWRAWPVYVSSRTERRIVRRSDQAIARRGWPLDPPRGKSRPRRSKDRSAPAGLRLACARKSDNGPLSQSSRSSAVTLAGGRGPIPGGTTIRSLRAHHGYRRRDHRSGRIDSGIGPARLWRESMLPGSDRWRQVPWYDRRTGGRCGNLCRLNRR